MKLENLAEAKLLDERRTSLLTHLDAAIHGRFDGYCFSRSGMNFPLERFAATDLIRQAAVNACIEKLIKIDAELSAIGIELPIDQHPPHRDLADWKLLAEMYERAWREAVGEPLPDRPHLIDALTERTRELKELADQFAAMRDAAKGPTIVTFTDVNDGKSLTVALPESSPRNAIENLPEEAADYKVAVGDER